MAIFYFFSHEISSPLHVSGWEVLVPWWDSLISRLLQSRLYRWRHSSSTRPPCVPHYSGKMETTACDEWTWPCFSRWEARELVRISSPMFESASAKAGSFWIDILLLWRSNPTTAPPDWPNSTDGSAAAFSRTCSKSALCTSDGDSSQPHTISWLDSICTPLIEAGGRGSSEVSEGTGASALLAEGSAEVVALCASLNVFFLPFMFNSKNLHHPSILTLSDLVETWGKSSSKSNTTVSFSFQPTWSVTWCLRSPNLIASSHFT